MIIARHREERGGEKESKKKLEISIKESDTEREINKDRRS